MANPLCFVLMPFGKKRDPVGGPDIDFDRIYEMAIGPAIRAAGLEPVRADHEVTGGIIHKAMFERLLLCEFAVADLTTANANVLYELGVRHATRPRTTLMTFAEKQPLPFDVAPLRALPYRLGENNNFAAAEADALKGALTARLKEVRALAYDQAAVDSPLVHLLQGYTCPDVAHLRTDVFRTQVDYGEEIRHKLEAARATKPQTTAQQALEAIEQSLGPLDAVETGALIDLFLSYRAVSGFDQMLALFDRMPHVVRRTVLVREQLAFALNRKAGKSAATEKERLRNEATRVLEEVIAERGPNGETCGLLGRIYKDRWDETRGVAATQARGYLRKAIAAYSRGFSADWRDAYPGINAATLLDLEGSPPSLAERDRIVPVVRFAVEQRLLSSSPDYWDHATLLELAVLANAPERADDHLSDALANVRESFEPETTSRNLKLLTEARAARGEDVAWIEKCTTALDAAARARKGE